MKRMFDVTQSEYKSGIWLVRRPKTRTSAGNTVKMPGDAAHIGVRRSLYIRGIPENVASNEIQNEMQVAKFRVMRNRGLC